MDAIDLTAQLIKLSNDPHCVAELEDKRPMSHWKTHCVNCGVYMDRPHVKDDCPPQNYEKLPSPRRGEQ